MANTNRNNFAPRAATGQSDLKSDCRKPAFLPARPATLVLGAIVLLLFAPACVPAALYPENALALAQAPTVAAPPPLTQRDEADIRWFSMILADPATDPAIRAGAAERLRDLRLPQATEVLASALTGGETHVKLAVIHAMNAAAQPIDGLLQPAVAALHNVPEEALEPLAGALARYGEAGVEHVARLARDADAPITERLNAVHALGVFRLRVAAIELMAVLDEIDAHLKSETSDGSEAHRQLLNGVCAALHRGTGLPYGNDVEQWRRWWADARHQPQEAWLTRMVQRLSEQLADASQQVRREREAAQHIERRLVEFLRDQFPLLPPDEQLRQLPAMLDDPLPVVREFGMDRVSRMLRDAVRIPDEVQHKLADRLSDDLPRLRLQAARLLDQLNHDGLAARLARRLSTETSAEVAGGLLDIIARRSPVAAHAGDLLQHVQPWITHPTLGQRAAAAAWEIVILSPSGAQGQYVDFVRDAARSILTSQPSPAHARLLVYVGDADDLRWLEDLLDSDDRDLRRHVAEGFARRGVRRPLIDRAADEAIYPFAVRSLKIGPADVPALRHLASLRPDAVNEEHAALWLSALIRIAESVPHAQAAEADDLLATVADVPTQARIDALRKHMAGPGETMEGPAGSNGEVRADLAARLGGLLISIGRHQEAHETLEQFNGASPTRALRAVKFEAAALSGQYAAAAQMNGEPGPWIELLVKTAERDAGLAAALRDEIEQRFEGRLQGEHEANFHRVTEHLRNLATDRADGQEA